MMTEEEKQEGRSLARELSRASETRLMSLRYLEEELRSLQDALETASLRSELAQIVGKLDRLESEVDACVTADLVSGKSTAKLYRKSLVARLEAMRDHAEALYAERAKKDQEEPCVKDQEEPSVKDQPCVKENEETKTQEKDDTIPIRFLEKDAKETDPRDEEAPCEQKVQQEALRFAKED